MENRYGEWIHDVDVIVPTPMDGTTTTFMFAEKFQLADREHVLTTVQHSPGGNGEDSWGLWQINGAASDGGVLKGDWITDVSHEPAGLAGQSTVAMETLHRA